MVTLKEGTKENTKRMRFLMMVKATSDTEAGVMPSEKLMSDMMKFNEEMAHAGVMKDGAGLKPTRHGARVKFSEGRVSVLDGPFTEAKELIAGYWLIEAGSLEEAVGWAKRCPAPMGDGKDAEIEIRPLYEMEDFGPEAPVETAKRIEAVIARKGENR